VVGRGSGWSHKLGDLGVHHCGTQVRDDKGYCVTHEFEANDIVGLFVEPDQIGGPSPLEMPCPRSSTKPRLVRSATIDETVGPLSPVALDRSARDITGHVRSRLTTRLRLMSAISCSCPARALRSRTILGRIHKKVPLKKSRG